MSTISILFFVTQLEQSFNFWILAAIMVVSAISGTPHNICRKYNHCRLWRSSHSLLWLRKYGVWGPRRLLCLLDYQLANFILNTRTTGLHICHHDIFRNAFFHRRSLWFPKLLWCLSRRVLVQPGNFQAHQREEFNSGDRRTGRSGTLLADDVSDFLSCPLNTSYYEIEPSSLAYILSNSLPTRCTKLIFITKPTIRWKILLLLLSMHTHPKSL